MASAVNIPRRGPRSSRVALSSGRRRSFPLASRLGRGRAAASAAAGDGSERVERGLLQGSLVEQFLGGRRFVE